MFSKQEPIEWPPSALCMEFVSLSFGMLFSVIASTQTHTQDGGTHSKLFCIEWSTHHDDTSDWFRGCTSTFRHYVLNQSDHTIMYTITPLYTITGTIILSHIKLTLFFVFNLAPCWCSVLRMSTWPLYAAIWAGVSWFCENNMYHQTWCEEHCWKN